VTVLRATAGRSACSGPGRSGGAARVLVPEHQELGIFGHLTPGQHHQAAEQTANEQVGDREDHSAMIPARKTGHARSNNRAQQDPLVPPAGVLGGEPPDERGDLGAGRRPSRWGQAHLRVTSRRCHRSTVPGVTSRCIRRLRGRSRISAARTARPAQSSCGRGPVRRSTATSCRSTSSPTSLDAAERPSRTSQPQRRTTIR
jgi:hypothetical protein